MVRVEGKDLDEVQKKFLILSVELGMEHFSKLENSVMGYFSKDVDPIVYTTLMYNAVIMFVTNALLLITEVEKTTDSIEKTPDIETFMANMSQEVISRFKIISKDVSDAS